MQLYVFWNDEYGEKLLPFSKGAIMLNVKNHVFSPLEYRSLRAVEVFLCPSNEEERSQAEILRKELNKYGVVLLIKKQL